MPKKVLYIPFLLKKQIQRPNISLQSHQTKPNVDNLVNKENELTRHATQVKHTKRSSHLFCPRVLGQVQSELQGFFFCSAADRSGRGKCFFVLVVVGDLGRLFSYLLCTLKMGASRENCSSKWVHPEKTVL